tara:strand:- start:920 stop:2365 length:1446 start_codon:yes stop_codon:yes gene_type:complete
MSFLGLGLMTLAVLFYFFARTGSDSQNLLYQTHEITSGIIESTVNASGTIAPVVTVEVGSELSGVISELKADFNSEVEKGQLIARLDNRTIRARLQQSEADLAMARALLEQQRAGLNKALAQLTLAKYQHNRQSELLGRQLVSQSEVDNKFAMLRMAEADVELSRAQIRASEAQLLQRQAQLEQAELNLERTEIRSPVSGIVINRQVDIGQTVAASLSAPLLFEIAQDLAQMQIEADVDEADIGKLSRGQQVRFQVDAYPSREFEGQVSQIRKASTTVSNVVTYKVIITAANADQSLLPGMTANVDIVLGKKENVLRVPNTALRFRPANASQLSGRSAVPFKESILALDLRGQQKQNVDLMLKEFDDEVKAFKQKSVGNWRSEERLEQIRQKFTNQLKLSLSQEQFEQFEQFSSLSRNHISRGKRVNMNYSLGEVWILKDGSPNRISVKTGLSNDQYTELIGNKLSAGTSVIVRVSRRQNK